MSRDQRAQWFLNRFARPSVESETRQLERERVNNPVQAPLVQWEQLGPFNVAG